MFSFIAIVFGTGNLGNHPKVEPISYAATRTTKFAEPFPDCIHLTWSSLEPVRHGMDDIGSGLDVLVATNKSSQAPRVVLS